MNNSVLAALLIKAEMGDLVAHCYEHIDDIYVPEEVEGKTVIVALATIPGKRLLTRLLEWHARGFKPHYVVESPEQEPFDPDDNRYKWPEDRR